MICHRVASHKQHLQHSQHILPDFQKPEMPITSLQIKDAHILFVLGT